MDLVTCAAPDPAYIVGPYKRIASWAPCAHAGGAEQSHRCGHGQQLGGGDIGYRDWDGLTRGMGRVAEMS